MMIDIIDSGIYRLNIPFENFTTSVYFYICDDGVAIIDCATYPSDVDNYIVPALEKLGVSSDDVKFILLSHWHGDHRGGLKRLSELYSDAVIATACDISAREICLTDNRQIIGNLRAIALPGHTDDSFGFFDTASKTLLSADCLQLDGVDKYRNGIEDIDDYIRSIEKLKSLNIKRIIAAHEYIPLGSVADGYEAVEQYLDACLYYAKQKFNK